MKVNNTTGAGIMDVLKTAYNTGKNIYNKAKDTNAYLKKQRYVGRAVEAIPEIKNIPYIGGVVSALAQRGYGKKMKGIKKAPYITANTVYGMEKI